jgi:2-oxoisovalerate dehydrogenase E1 component alpha subunit
LVSKGWWSEPEDADLVKRTKSDVMKAFTRAEKLPKPKLSEMFNDVWAVQPGEKVPTIIVGLSDIKEDTADVKMEQRAELGRLLKKYGDVWEPWRKERMRFVEQGEDVMDCDGRDT